MPFITQGKTNVKYLFIIIIVAIFAGGITMGTFKLMKCPFWWPSAVINQTTGDETAGWQTYKNETYGFTFKYPENFGANVWKPLFWPPTTTVVSISEDPVAKGCPDFPLSYLGTQGATQKTVKINNIDYALYWASDGAAGSSYNSYCYVTKKDQNYYLISFVIRTTNGCGDNCGPYCGTQYETECRNFDFSKDVEIPIRKIMFTFRFLEEELCKNLCGDEICQEIVCLAIGCPCPETKESCPQDCK